MERIIDDFPLYAVTDDGKVINRKTRRVLRPADNNAGYLKVGLIKDGKFHSQYVHKLVAETFLGKCPEGYQIDHIDNNRHNNCLSNLQFLTPKENVRKSIPQMRNAIRHTTLKKPLHHIWLDNKRQRYAVDIKKDGIRHRWYFYKLEDAIKKRDEAYAEIYRTDTR